MRTQRTIRTTIGLAVTGLAAGLVLAGPAEAATGPARSSTTWLGNQLTEGLVESEYDDGTGTYVGYTDFGLTLDVFYALDEVGVRHRQQNAILGAIEPRAGEYTDAWSTYAGAVGKLLTAVQAEGVDPATYASGDLLPRLEELVEDSGPEQGRAKDAPPAAAPATADTSNTFGQSFVVTALTNAGSDEADEAVEFLLQQQCDAGFFRESMGTSTFTCESGTAEESRPDIDATATAVTALRTIRDDLPVALRDDVQSALRKGARWLVSQQRRSGTFSGGANTNSTGLAATALAETGRTAAARKAARWVNKLRVTPRMARRTALRKADVGAIAFDVAALRQAKRNGLARDDRYQWRRSTAQAAPALDVL